MKKRPYLRFYGTDWRGDAGLRSVSFAARGLWIDMLTLMHEAEEYGHLIVNGRAPDAKRLASMLGGAEREIAKLLAELEDEGIFSRRDDGVILSRRMIRDREKELTDIANGKGGGNPALRADVNPNNGGPDNGGVNPPVNRTDNDPDKARARAPLPLPLPLPLPYPEKEERKLNTPPESASRATRSAPDGAEFDGWWAAYPRKEDKGHARKAYATALRKTDAGTLLAALGRQWPTDPRYIPMPATWLNGERWTDERDDTDPVLKAAGLRADGTLQSEQPNVLRLVQ